METGYITIQEQLTVTQGVEYTVCVIRSNIGNSDGTSEKETIKFTNLEDTPDSYEGNSGKMLIVKEDETGIIFAKTVKKFTDLEDCPKTLANSGGKLLVVSKEGDRITTIQYNPKDLNIEYFTQLADTFGSYTGKGGQVLTIKDDETGLESKAVSSLTPAVGKPNTTYTNPKVITGPRGEINQIIPGPADETPNYNAGEILIGKGDKYPTTFANPIEKKVLIFNPTSNKHEWVSIVGIGDLFDNPVLTTETGSIESTVKAKFTRDPNGNMKLSVTGQSDKATLIVDGTDLYLVGGSLILGDGSIIDAKSDIIVNLISGRTVKLSDSTDLEAYTAAMVDKSFVTKKFVADSIAAIPKPESVIPDNLYFENVLANTKINIPVGRKLIFIKVTPTSIPQNMHFSVIDKGTSAYLYRAGEDDAYVYIGDSLDISTEVNITADTDIEVTCDQEFSTFNVSVITASANT